MTALGTPLLAFRDVALCDRMDHEVALVTDGQTAYTYGIAATGSEAGAVCRSGIILTAACQQPTGRHGDPCDGYVTWALDAKGGWGADGDARALLSLGKPVEQ